MEQKRYTIHDVMREARAEVAKWPESMRSDHVRRALRELEERKRTAQDAERRPEVKGKSG